MTRRPLLIVNPRSANGATGRHFDTLSTLVRAQVGDFDHAFTERPMHAAELTRRAVGEGCELVIAVGGDGTLNEAVNGFFEPAAPGSLPKTINPRAALGILPRGTGGDLRRTLGLDGDLARSAKRLASPAKAIDVGFVEYEGAEGERQTRCFLNVSGTGVGAEIVDRVNQGSKLLGGKLTFLLGSAVELARWQDVPVRASLDGGPFEELKVTSYSVANGKYFGGGMKVAPEAKLDDGLFHVTVWSGFDLRDFVVKSASLYDGAHVRFPGTRTATARTVRLEPGASTGQRVARVEVDGEPVGRLPATYTLLPGALRVHGA